MNAASEQLLQLEEKLQAATTRGNDFQVEISKLQSENARIDSMVDELEHDCAEATEVIMVSELNCASFVEHYYYLT